jgi:peroxiredoxin
MRIPALILAFTLVAGAGLAQQTTPPKTHLKVGDAAPDFTLRTTDGNNFSLAAQHGKTVVLAFFPAAFTGG